MRLVLLALADVADHEGVSCHTIEELKKSTGFCQTSVNSAIWELEYCKRLTVKEDHYSGRGNRYALALWQTGQAPLSIVSGAKA